MKDSREYTRYQDTDYKVFSGGQTGVDQAGLAAAKKVRFNTSGWMPKGFKTEDGPRPDLGSLYGLKEDSSASYVPRTHKNAAEAQVTLWWGTTTSPGYRCTLEGCNRVNVPLFNMKLHTVKETIDYILSNNFTKLNIAGHRESKHPGIYEESFNYILQVFEGLKEPKALKLPETEVGDIWLKDGFKIISTNLGGVHGRGLAKQAKDKGLITRLNVDFDSRPRGHTFVITVAVKGNAPETAKVPGQAFSEQCINGNVDLIESEVEKVIAMAKRLPNLRFNLPYIGLGFGEGEPEQILPILYKAAKVPNIVLISKDATTIERYRDSFKPGCRRDGTAR